MNASIKTSRCYGHNSIHRAYLQTPKSLSSSQEPCPSGTEVDNHIRWMSRLKLCHETLCLIFSLHGRLWWESTFRAQIRHRTTSGWIDKIRRNSNACCSPTFSATHLSDAPTIANKTTRDKGGMPEAIINLIYSQEGISNPMRSKAPKIKQYNIEDSVLYILLPMTSPDNLMLVSTFPHVQITSLVSISCYYICSVSFVSIAIISQTRPRSSSSSLAFLAPSHGYYHPIDWLTLSI